MALPTYQQLVDVLDASQLAAVLPSYFQAVASCGRGGVDVSSSSSGFSSGGEEVIVKDLSSDISVNSSASNVRAAKRARWRANKRVLAKVVPSDVTYSCGAEYDGNCGTYPYSYCYLALVNGQHRAAVAEVMKEDPTFRDFLSIPVSSLGSYWEGYNVVKGKAPGTFLIHSEIGVNVVSCFRAVASQGRGWLSGSIAEYVLSKNISISPILIAKSPKLWHVLGSGDKCRLSTAVPSVMSCGRFGVGESDTALRCTGSLSPVGRLSSEGPGDDKVPVGDVVRSSDAVGDG